MLTAAQLDGLLQLGRPVTSEEVDAFNDIELRSTPIDAVEDHGRIVHWLEAVGFSGIPRQWREMSDRLAAEVRAVAKLNVSPAAERALASARLRSHAESLARRARRARTPQARG